MTRGTEPKRTREEYWTSQIAFDCPFDGKRRTVDDCFNSCHSSDYFYDERGGIVYCQINQRELQTGDSRQKNTPTNLRELWGMPCGFTRIEKIQITLECIVIVELFILVAVLVQGVW